MTILKQKILKQMAILTPKQKLENEIFKEIGSYYKNYKSFQLAFEATYKRVIREINQAQK